MILFILVAINTASDPIMSDFRRYGFKGVIAKPYEINELNEVLREVLKDSSNGNRG